MLKRKSPCASAAGLGSSGTANGADHMKKRKKTKAPVQEEDSDAYIKKVKKLRWTLEQKQADVHSVAARQARLANQCLAGFNDDQIKRQWGTLKDAYKNIHEKLQGTGFGVDDDGDPFLDLLDDFTGHNAEIQQDRYLDTPGADNFMQARGPATSIPPTPTPAHRPYVTPIAAGVATRVAGGPMLAPKRRGGVAAGIRQSLSEVLSAISANQNSNMQIAQEAADLERRKVELAEREMRLKEETFKLQQSQACSVQQNPSYGFLDQNTPPLVLRALLSMLQNQVGEGAGECAAVADVPE
ncbi:hypothetical protein HDU93_007761 [Gonapodya sp. JEL0774]|nr:hypothetical protein HDU93_007761 [Gonapodya sp. JEL0774]